MTGGFIVSTGRCGSTVLSEILAGHPGVAVLQELFASLPQDALALDRCDGPTFWRLATTPRADWKVALQRRVEPKEFQYPIDAGGRYDRRSGVPPLAAICLPALSSDPDELLRALEEPIKRMGARPTGCLLEEVFELLARSQDAASWIERSGGSIAYAAALVRRFPHARYLHLHRDGRETAISMSNHLYFRTILASGSATNLEHISLERFGLLWSTMIRAGEAALRDLEASQVAHLSYEELVAEPRRCLERILDFFELDAMDEDWHQVARRSLHSQPSRYPALGKDARSSLDAACRLGQRQLAMAAQAPT
jgi:Sulfotransferase family